MIYAGSSDEVHSLRRGRKIAAACLLLALAAFIAPDLLAEVFPLGKCLLYRRIYMYLTLSMVIPSVFCGVAVFFFYMRGKGTWITWFLVFLGLSLSALTTNSLYLQSRLIGTTYITRCAVNISKFADAIIEYVKANNGRLPSTEHWYDELISRGYLKENNFVCGDSFWPGHFSYAMNKNLDGLYVEDLTNTTVIVFEIDDGRIPSGDADSVVYRHEGNKANFLLGDFSIFTLTKEDAKRLEWEVKRKKE